MAKAAAKGAAKGAAKAAAKPAARKDDREAFAARPETTGKVKVAAPQTGADYLASLSDGREVYIYGERVKDVTKHRRSATPRAWWRGCTTRCTIPSARTRSCCRPRPATAA